MYSFNSYLHMFIFISGIIAIIMALNGCYASKIPNRCCMCMFTSVSVAFMAVFGVFAVVMVTIYEKNDAFVGSFCDQETLITDLNITAENKLSKFLLDLSKTTEQTIFQTTKETFEEIDVALGEYIEQYMCKAECPCDARGLQTLSLWSPEKQEQFRDSSVYFFNGEFRSFFDCYQELTQKDVIPR